MVRCLAQLMYGEGQSLGLVRLSPGKGARLVVRVTAEHRDLEQGRAPGN